MRKRVGKYRSKFERDFAALLRKKGLDFEYESVTIKYTEPKEHTYHADWSSKTYPFIIETKGRFTARDRRKHLAIRSSNPGSDIRFVFQNARNFLYRGSNTRYFEWAEANGFKWAQGTIPDSWLKERKV